MIDHEKTLILKHTHKELKDIWHQVPPDYYQNGIRNNILQKIWHSGKLRAVLNLMTNQKKPAKILDVGCASGWFLSEVAKKYPEAEYFGVDVYKNAVRYGQKKYKNLTLVYADGHKLPFPDNHFDVVICAEVLEHVVDPEKVLREIERVLAKRGIAIVEMDSGNLLFRLVWHWWTNLRHGVWKDAHIHVFNAEKLERTIRKNGFIVSEKKIFNCTMAVAFRLVKK